MKSLTDLFYKCYKNDLHFSYSAHVKHVEVYKFDDDKTQDERITIISRAWLDGNEEEQIIKMHQEVDAYLNRISVPFMDEHETEHAQAALTEQERKMKEVGHKEADFS